jgi:RNA polymerase sigma-70 factor (ECF subfamily)
MSIASRDLQTLFSVGTLGGLPDGKLLERFAAHREEATFEALVRRHGPMVWGVCRRILRDHHNAEDAFQATFLVLARKGHSIAHRELVANWLYGVAYQTALKARSMRARRRIREAQVTEMPEPDAVSQDHRDDLIEWLDRELSRLPDKYRIPIVLCELEGKTHREAAERLGWPIGTVSGRLSRAKAMLARRLSRRGMSISAGSLAVLLTQESASASMPTRLIGSTAQAASLYAAGGAATAGMVSAGVVVLAGEMMKNMLLSKLKGMSIVLLMMAFTGTGLVWMATRDPAAGQETVNSEAATGAAEPAEKDEEAIQGVWTVVNLEQVSHQPTEEEKSAYKSGRFTITIRGNKLTFDADKSLMYFKLDPSQSPKVMTLEVPDGPTIKGPVPAIYRLDGDDMMICQGRLGDTQPPAGFSVTDRRPGTFPTLWVLKRRPSPSDVGREVKNADRSQGKTDTNAPAQLPGMSNSVFGGGPNEPRYERHDNLFFVTSPLGDKFSIYGLETNKASTVKLPGSKESSLQVTPIIGPGTLISLSLNGPKLTRLYVFSLADWKWYPQDIKKPVAGVLNPIVGSSVAGYTQCRTIYAFSTGAKRWSILEIPEKAPAQPGMRVSSDSIVVEYDGHIYEFSGETGEWKHTDLRALIGAAIKAAEDEAK